MDSTGKLLKVIVLPYKNKEGVDKEKLNVIADVVDGDFTKPLAFEVWKEDLIAKCKNIPIGSKVEIKWSPSSNEWQGKWFSKFSAWSVEAIPDSATNIPSYATAGGQPQNSVAIGKPADPQLAPQEGDLPF